MKKRTMAELHRLSTKEYLHTPKLPVTVILDNIRSCHNTGSVFRTADALMIEKIWLCGITATPPDKEIHKTALDAEKVVAWEYAAHASDVVSHLHTLGYRVYAVEQVENSIPLPAFLPLPGEKIALIFGNEVKGVQQEVVDLCDGAIEIPQFGTKHSFNVSVSAGIVLWDITQKIRFPASHSHPAPRE
ncbi:MAG TPA: RNA methyltransferase [Prolixibacteraceae bacterium]|jgi:tRNA G18 (ribose-2'-O)-methylase SpoU|nr:RNA methyltransferase [Prolixibacteraceae bacterium]HOY52019.1 RNA methyltransferase [Prolixibacteraceae bacterium]